MKLGIYVSESGQLLELRRSSNFNYHLYSTDDCIYMKFDEGSEWVLDDFQYVGSI
jgi:hypothetical protein